MPVEHVRVSQQGRDQLVRLKRYTGIQNWNVLCRWALCLSLSEPSVPAPTRIPSDSNLEMTWKTFAGEMDEVFVALLRQRCPEDGLGADDDTVVAQFRLHLHRGIGYLAGNVNLRGIRDLVNLTA